MVFVYDDNEEVDNYNDESSDDESFDLESCVTDNEVDPRAKISAWLTHTRKHAFTGIRPFLLRPPSLLSFN